MTNIIKSKFGQRQRNGIRKAHRVICAVCDGTGERFLFLHDEDMTDKHCKQCNGYGWHMTKGEADGATK